MVGTCLQLLQQASRLELALSIALELGYDFEMLKNVRLVIRSTILKGHQ